MIKEDNFSTRAQVPSEGSQTQHQGVDFSYCKIISWVLICMHTTSNYSFNNLHSKQQGETLMFIQILCVVFFIHEYPSKLYVL